MGMQRATDKPILCGKLSCRSCTHDLGADHQRQCDDHDDGEEQPVDQHLSVEVGFHDHMPADVCWVAGDKAARLTASL